jgi:hypothetical protein
MQRGIRDFRTGATIWLGLLATLEVIPFRAYAPFPAPPPSFKYIVKFVFCEGGSASPAILPRSSELCKNGRLSVLSSVREIEIGWVGDDNHVVFGKNIPYSVVAKVRSEVFSHFHAFAMKCHSSMLERGQIQNINKLCRLSPRANYTDRATAACWRN